jgi:hypothetical protein
MPDLCFVSDVTIPDNSVMEPGQSFTKTWRVKNCGDVAWGSEATLRFASGAQMGAPDSVSVDDVVPGNNVDISVNMVAPSAAGTYRGEWRLHLASGARLGDSVWVVIVVSGPPPGVPGEVQPGETGGNLTGPGGETRTIPCGDPIPDGWICTCNCVTVPAAPCSCDSVCTCDTVCTCQGHGHYWYPN